MGLLLGTRNFQAAVPWFHEGDRLNVTATLVFMDSQIGSFDCTVARAESGAELAQARLTLYRLGDAMTLPEAAALGSDE